MKRYTIILCLILLALSCENRSPVNGDKRKEIINDWKEIGTKDCLFRITQDSIIYLNEGNSKYKYSMESLDTIAFFYPDEISKFKILFRQDTISFTNAQGTTTYSKCSD